MIMILYTTPKASPLDVYLATEERVDKLKECVCVYGYVVWCKKYLSWEKNE